MARSSASSWTLASVGREAFQLAMEANGREGNAFARTFVRKADNASLWPSLGAWRNGDLLGAICWTVGKRQPATANLQLLHTFAAYRALGVARSLCERFLLEAGRAGASYFRVSSEPPAVGFYRKLDIRFVGVQKSGCLLAVGRLGPCCTFAGCHYGADDPHVLACAMRKGKGGCVEVFAVPT